MVGTALSAQVQFTEDERIKHAAMAADVPDTHTRTTHTPFLLLRGSTVEHASFHRGLAQPPFIPPVERWWGGGLRGRVLLEAPVQADGADAAVDGGGGPPQALLVALLVGLVALDGGHADEGGALGGQRGAADPDGVLLLVERMVGEGEPRGLEQVTVSHCEAPKYQHTRETRDPHDTRIHPRTFWESARAVMADAADITPVTRVLACRELMSLGISSSLSCGCWARAVHRGSLCQQSAERCC